MTPQAMAKRPEERRHVTSSFAPKIAGSVGNNPNATAMRLSPEATLYFLGKLVRDGKATITGIEARD